MCVSLVDIPKRTPSSSRVCVLPRRRVIVSTASTLLNFTSTSPFGTIEKYLLLERYSSNLPFSIILQTPSASSSTTANFASITMLSVVTISILLLNAFSSVHADGCDATCSRSISHKYDGSFPPTCECDSPDNSACYKNDGAGSGSDTACRQHCCKRCSSRRLLQEESENSTSSNYTASDPMCFCYGALKEIDPNMGCPFNFEGCSELCNSTCFGELGDCEVAPLFVHEKKPMKVNTAENYISEWKASGISGKVCVCKNIGFKIGTIDIADFQEQDCFEFCSQADSLGGVGVWLTTDELSSPPPNSSPIELTSPPTTYSPTQQSNTPTWAVAFFASVVCVGFLMITVLFCSKPNLGSGSR